MQVNIKKRYIYAILGLLVVLVGSVAINAYGTSDPTVFGHTCEEITGLEDYIATINLNINNPLPASEVFEPTESTSSPQRHNINEFSELGNQTWTIISNLKYKSLGTVQEDIPNNTIATCMANGSSIYEQGGQYLCNTTKSANPEILGHSIGEIESIDNCVTQKVKETIPELANKHSEADCLAAGGTIVTSSPIVSGRYFCQFTGSNCNAGGRTGWTTFKYLSNTNCCQAITSGGYVSCSTYHPSEYPNTWCYQCTTSIGWYSSSPNCIFHTGSEGPSFIGQCLDLTGQPLPTLTCPAPAPSYVACY